MNAGRAHCANRRDALPGAPTREDTRIVASAERRPRGTLRLAAAAILAAAALLSAVLAGHARSLGNALLARAVVVGEAPDAATNLGDDAHFAPFAFGVVGPIRGDAARAARAVESLAARDDLSFVVLLGELTRDGTEGELLRLAASVRDRGVEVLVVPAAADLAGARRALVQTHLGAARWWFVHRECLIAGLRGDADDAAFLARAAPSGRDARRTTIALTVGDAPAADGGDSTVLRPAEGVRIVRVTSDGRATVDAWDVPTGPTPRTVVRDISLGSLFPLVRTMTGHVLVLAAAALALAGSVRIAVRGGA